MEKSTEIRWFISEQDFTFLERLFGQGPFNRCFELPATFARKDIYLKIDNSDLGIKIREPKKDKEGSIGSKIELKLKVGNDLPTNKHNNIEGLINRWIKYGFSLEKDEKTLLQFLDTNDLPAKYPNWIEIEKERLLIKYDVINKSHHGESIKLEEGCGIELTKIRIQGKPYYTFGFEAFSVSGRDEENLKDTIEYFHNHFKPKGLVLENSKSYPDFIQSIIKF